MNKTHGKSYTPVYASWKSMRNRCKNHTPYTSRGITVCKRWESFDNFYADVGDIEEGMTIDRIDNTKGYYPENIRFVTHQENMINVQSSKRWHIDGVEYASAREAARQLGVAMSTIRRWCLGEIHHRSKKFTPPKPNCYAVAIYGELPDD